MLITKKSNLSGIEHTIDINVDPEKLRKWEEQGKITKIQNEFPELSSSEREFLLSGITELEWDEMMLDDEEPFEPDYEEAI